MKEDDLLYGAHSGIQKAVRRGDLDLCKTCFNLLWSEKKHKSWLKWRLPSIVIEEAWYFSGRLKEFTDKKSEDPDEWLRFLYELTLIRKVKDADAIFYVPDTYKSAEPEAVDRLNWIPKTNDPTCDIVGLADDLASACNEVRELTPYESSVMKVLKGRARMGGMFGDRIMSLAAILLLTHRGIEEGYIDDLVEVGLKRWVDSHGKRKPKTVNLPWYVFDFHTQVGKIAVSIWRKNKSHKYQIKDLHAVWFYLESGHVPSFMREENLKNPSAFEEKWWPLFKEYSIKKGGGGEKDVKLSWKRTIRDELKGIVEWVLEKRENGGY